MELSDIFQIITIGVATTLLILGIVIINISYGSTMSTNFYAWGFGISGLILLSLLMGEL